MSTSVPRSIAAGDGSPAPLVRIFGWLNLTVMAAFILNAILTFWFKWPGVLPLIGLGKAGGSAVLMGVQAAIYGGGVALAFYIVAATRDRTLRLDAKIISDANRFLIRAAFWIVFLVGLVDAAISFVRVEGLLPGLVGEQWAADLGKSQFRGIYVHVPVVLLGILIGAVTRSLGFIWLALLVVIAELLIVFSRFVFSYEQAFMGDLVRFWYAALFLFASAYTLLEDGHVRVDVFYAGFRTTTRGYINAFGSILLGISFCWTILLIGMWSASSIIVSPILVFETTQAGFGMYVKYFMAGFLGIFAVSMMIQFVSYLLESWADLRGEPGHRDHEAIMH